MKWEAMQVETPDISCALSSDHTALIEANHPDGFLAVIQKDGWDFANLGCFQTQAAAKSAVAAWIGKTIAQLGNALAAGEPRTFDDDGA